MVGNGRLAVAFGGQLSVRDFFYPWVVEPSFRTRAGDEDLGGRSLQLAGRPLADRYMYFPKPLASRSHASNAVLQIGIETNNTVHRAHDGLLTVLA